MPVLLIASLAIATAVPPQQRCTPPAPQRAGAALAVPHRLDKLPPASLYLAVDRRIDECPAPIIVRTAIGNNR